MSDNWESADYELPSVNEAKEASTFLLPDGSYQFAIVDIKTGMENKYDADKPRLGITFKVVKSDDPADVGRETRFYYTESTHPKSNLYPLFRAAAGGDLDPNIRPKLIDLRHKEIRATLLTNEDGNQKMQGILPVRSENYVNPPF